MNKIKSKKVHIAIVVMALLFLTGGYFAHSFMGANNDDANISKASAKTDAGRGKKEWRSDGREGIEYLRERSKNVIQM